MKQEGQNYLPGACLL